MSLDLEKILQEAHHRWLRPPEICEILGNHKKFYLTQEPSHKPPGGSLFLFDRKVVKHFRKDGHNWRKKKDGKTLKEAHEKMKAGGIEVLHCYYAHGADNKNFQRRSYWMIEEQLEHIVLVHYREVKEGYRLGASSLRPVHAGPLLENPQSTTYCNGSGLKVQESHTSNPSSVDGKEQALFSELQSGDSKGLVEFTSDRFQLNPQLSSFMSAVFHSLDRNLNATLQLEFYLRYLNVVDLLSIKLAYARLAGEAVKDVANSRNRLTITSGEVFEKNIHGAPAQIQNISRSRTVVTPDAVVQASSLEGGLNSEVQDFEYPENPSKIAVHLQVRLANLLYSGVNKQVLDCPCGECESCKLKSLLCSLKCKTGNAFERLKDGLAIIEGNNTNYRDVLIQNFMKDKLYEWLVSRAHTKDKDPNTLDDEGQGVIHLVASLGYDWGLLPLIAAGISTNFRDACGRTALHWAAYYGREDMVIALIKVGVAAGAVDDPTAAFPGGRTAADLASSRGHKGIAGYLAESDLTAHLQSLATNNNALDNIGAGLEAEKAFEAAAQEVVPLNGTIDDDISVKGSLTSLRKSAHSAALIQAAFRARSFRQRQLTESRNDVSEASLDLVALGSLNRVQKVNHFEDYLDSAALKTLQKNHDWKGRREFMKIRNRIVKIQAHVHGHQVRKPHKKFVWLVSILEKVILRWKRKRTGLRGFRPEKTSQKGTLEFEKEDEYEYLSIGRKQKLAGVENALARVQSMVRHPEARDQYMRLVVKFENTRVNLSFW